MNIWSSRAARLGMVALGCAVACLGALGVLTAQGKTEVVVSTSEWASWQMFDDVAKKSEGLFSPVKTTSKRFNTLNASLEYFLDGDAPAATLTIFEALCAHDRFPDDIAIVLLFDYTTGSDGIVGKPSIRSVLDLQGKTIGVEKGTIGHFTLIKALELAGLSTGDVRLVPFNQSNDVNPAYLRRVDAVATFEPQLSKIKAIAGFRTVFSSREIPTAICDVLVVRKRFARAHPDIIQHWRTAWFNATQPKWPIFGNHFSDPSSRLFPGIYLTNRIENEAAFGTPVRPGYLFKSIRSMAYYLKTEGFISQIPDRPADILYYP